MNADQLGRLFAKLLERLATEIVPNVKINFIQCFLGLQSRLKVQHRTAAAQLFTKWTTDTDSEVAALAAQVK